MVEKMFERKNLSSKEVYDFLTAYLEKHCSEYCEEKANYDECVVALSSNFAEGQQLIEAHIKRIVFSAGFAYEVGQRAASGSEYFIKQGPEVFLQESQMLSEPECVDIANTIRIITTKLTRADDKIYGKILEFYSLLDTYIPKLAHYLGYKHEVTLRKQNDCNFTENEALTSEYTEWLSEYLELDLKAVCLLSNR